MTEDDRFRRILWAVIAVCLLGALVAVPVVGDGGRSDDLRAGEGEWVDRVGSASSTTAAAAPEGAPEDAAGAPAATDATDGAAGPAAATPPPTTSRPAQAPGAAPAATDAPAATSPPTTAASNDDLGAPADPGPAKPPRVGTYRYKLTFGAETRDATTVIEDRGTNASETKQLVKMRGEGLDVDSDVSWRADGVHVLSSVIMFGDKKGSCDWEPDTLQLKLPIVKGATWESTSTCQMSGLTPAPIPVSRKITGKFLELRRIRIAGQVVDVWAIEGTEHTEAAGTVTDRSGVTLFSPKHGISVSSSGKVKSSGSNGTREVDYSNEIQNLDPE